MPPPLDNYALQQLSKANVMEAALNHNQSQLNLAYEVSRLAGADSNHFIMLDEAQHELDKALKAVEVVKRAVLSQN